MERVPLPRRSYETLRRLAALPAALGFLRLAVPSEHPDFAPWSAGCAAPGLGFGQRSPDRESSMEASRTPKVPGRAPLCTCPVLRPRRASASCHCRTPRCCLPLMRQRRPRELSAFVVQSHGPCTPCVRFAASGHPDATQHSVPVGGQPLPDRIGYLSGSIARFQALHSAPPCPSLPGATEISAG